MVTKGLKQESLKRASLAKTRKRREGMARDRAVSERRNNSRHNDLLPDLEVRQCPIADLRPPDRRTRKDDPDQIARIANSISEYKFTQPVLVRDGKVLDGWLRVLAAAKLGLDRVPVIECSHLGEAEARALAIAINRIGERGDWDLEELRLEFLELIELEVDLDATGFTVEERDIIILDPDGSDEDSGDELIDEPDEDPVTWPGDIWDLGEHRIVCGNALDGATYKTLLGDEKVHAVITDPPYNVKIQGNVSGLGKKIHKEFAMASGEMSGDQFQVFLNTCITLMAAWLATGAVLFAFMDWRSVHRLYAAGEAAGLRLINLVVWYKEAGAMGSLYRSAHELIAVFCKGAKIRTNNVELGRHGRNRDNVWVEPGSNRRGSSANEMLSAHATPKPVELYIDAILDVTRAGDLVLDVFLGSGTLLIAAEKTGRRARGIELEPGFVDVSIRRWQRHTGLKATLAATAETFEEIAERRTEQARSTEPSSTQGGE